jgi:outer membrane protein assembly factor BamB
LLIFATSAEVKASGLLTTAYTVTDGAVYVYFTVNGPRGEIVVLKDTGRR